jgi:hypothetical protein
MFEGDAPDEFIAPDKSTENKTEPSE